MSCLNRYTILPISVLTLHVGGCATTTAPPGWLPSPPVAQSDGFGGWISVKYDTENSKAEEHGELIAVGSNQIYVLTAEEWLSISTSKISHFKLTAYDSNSRRLSAWTFLGTLSAYSHGWGAILSWPVWIIGGSLSTRAQSLAPVRYYTPSLDELRAYARFPQGLYEEKSLRSLKPKPGPYPLAQRSFSQVPGHHDGFHFRLSSGIGPASGIGGHISSMKIEAGYAVVDNLIFTVQLFASGGQQIRVPVSGIGLGTTYYILPANFYFSGTIALAQGTTDDWLEESGTAYAVNVAVGREWWVTKNWALGTGGQLLHTVVPVEYSRHNPVQLRGKEFDSKATSIGLLFTVSFN